MTAIQNASGTGRPPGVHHAHVHIDMTPMVDVAMLLLTFFMLTAVFNKPQTMELNLPHGSVHPVPESKLLTLFIDRHSQIYSRMGAQKEIHPLPLNRVRNELSGLREKTPGIIALMKIDRGARYERMVDLLDELNCASIGRLSIAPLTAEEAAKLQSAAAR